MTRIGMNEALKRLRALGFKPEMLERGTIVAHKSEVHLAFFRSRRLPQTYNSEAIERAGVDYER